LVDISYTVPDPALKYVKLGEITGAVLMLVLKGN
jgi:hypothetical protein